MKKIQGQKYSFIIKSSDGKFFIKAVHNKTGRFSFIDNLNPILSIFEIPINDRRISESQWEISQREEKPLFYRTIDMLSSKPLLKYLEEYLEEDRRLSEWENIS